MVRLFPFGSLLRGHVGGLCQYTRAFVPILYLCPILHARVRVGERRSIAEAQHRYVARLATQRGTQGHSGRRQITGEREA